jgi:hypothetical protein
MLCKVWHKHIRVCNVVCRGYVTYYACVTLYAGVCNMPWKVYHKHGGECNMLCTTNMVCSGNMLYMGCATCYVKVCNLRMVWNPTIKVEAIGSFFCFVMIYFVMIWAPNPWHPTLHIVQIVGDDEYVCSFRVM